MHANATRYRDGMMPRLLRAAAVAVLAIVLAACPKPHRKTLVPEVPTSGDATARTRFIAARDAFERGADGQTEEFQAIADAYQGDPVEPFALLYAGIAAKESGSAVAAVESLQRLLALDELEPGLRRRGELYLGLAASYLGDADTALPLLAGAEGAIENDAERGEWLAAQVHAHLASATPLAALPWMDRFYPIATAAERAYLLGRGAEVVAAAEADAVTAAWATGGGDVSAALLGDRAARELAAADPDAAKRAHDRAAAARKALGLPAGDDAVPSGPIAIGKLGAIVAQSAKYARIAEQIARGLHVAAVTLGEGAPAIQIEDAEGAAAGDAVARLAGGEVMGIVGPADGASVDAASERAAELRVPLLSLNARAEERSGGAWVFHVMHSAEARARALVRRADRLGVKRFAILRPENGYGTAVAAAFRAEVAAAGGEIVDEVTYKADAKSFAGIVKKLGGAWQAVFVPDTADKVELIAPALAAAGFMARPAGTKKAPGGRPIVLLSTVEGAAADYVREAGRYSEGALFAPGYFPGAADERGAAFERAYQDATGKTPTAIEAYAYDAVRAIAAVVADGARDRADLARRLGSASVDGVTGTLRFDADHRRADDGVVYTVEVDAGAATVRSLR